MLGFGPISMTPISAFAMPIPDGAVQASVSTKPSIEAESNGGETIKAQTEALPQEP